MSFSPVNLAVLVSGSGTTLQNLIDQIRSGALDDIPVTVLADFPKVNRVHDAVADHASVKSWYARSAG